MLTYVKLAVANGGAHNQATALANSWAQFSTGTGPANVRTWDNRPMEYYTAGFGACGTTAQLVVMNLPSTSAQCGAFALLLESALAMNGIHSNWIQINSAYRPDIVKMMIKVWCFVGTAGCSAGSPSYLDEVTWKYKLSLNTGDYMAPGRLDYGDLSNLQGLPGQGGNGTTSPPYTPLEKVFNNHFIVQVPVLDAGTPTGNQYYDPSYGVTYPSATGFEAQAVAGFAAEFPGDEGTGRNHVFTPIPGAPNISFIPVPALSM